MAHLEQEGVQGFIGPEARRTAWPYLNKVPCLCGGGRCRDSHRPCEAAACWALPAHLGQAPAIRPQIQVSFMWPVCLGYLQRKRWRSTVSLLKPTAPLGYHTRFNSLTCQMYRDQGSLR